MRAKKRLLGCLLVFLLGLSHLEPVLAVPVEEQAGEPLPYGLYEISSALDENFCLDIDNASQADRANLQLYRRNHTNAQKFWLKPIDGEDGLYTIINASSGKVLDVNGNSKENGANVQQYTANGTTAQIFRLIVNPDGSYRIQGVGSERYVSVAGESAGNSVNVHIFRDDTVDAKAEAVEPEMDVAAAEADENTLVTQGAESIEEGEKEDTPQEEGNESSEEEETVPANQSWIITETKYQMPEEGLYEVTSALNQNYCLDVHAASLANSANVQLYGRNGTNAQKFYLKYLDKENNLVTLTNAGSAKLLDAKGNGKTNGTNIHQFEGNGTAAQIFRLVPSENGGIMLEGQGSGKMVDVNSARVANGTNIHLYERNNTAAQRWYFKATGYKFPSVARGKSVASTPVSAYVSIVAKGNTSLTVQPSAESSKSGIVLGGATNGTKDKWTMRELGGGRYEFINVATGFALDDKNASMADANQMWLFSINGTASQSWTPVDTGDGDGSFYLVCRQSGKYLDIRGANLKSGTVVQQYTGNKTIAQKFYFRNLSSKNGKVIVIDPGHSYRIPAGSEPIGPGAGTTKLKDTYGTRGVASGLPECELTLPMAKQLRTELEKRGYTVILTKETNDVAMSCIERTRVANNAKADAYIRLHADGGASSARGAMSVCITSGNPWKGHMFSKCQKLSTCLIDEYCKATGLRKRDTWYTDTMTGNNWSDVPTVLFEMGFMTNPTEDLWMANAANQKKMVQGLANGIDAFFR